MTQPRTLYGRILTPLGWRRGHVHFDTQVRQLQVDDHSGADDTTLPVILPGFVDLHVHGGAGVDLMQGGDVARTIAHTHARFGTTTLLATTMTAGMDEIEQALQGVANVMAAPDADAADIVGVHLEGPFISPQRLGAQPPRTVEATLARVQALHALAPIRVMTLAPEIGQHTALIPALAALGIRVQVGHSAGTYEDAVAALQAGAVGFTHLFNGMTGVDHYRPGIAAAALAHAQYAEIIPDLQHVHPGVIRLAARAIPRLYAVTDATAATGMPDGEYALGEQRVHKCMGCVRLASGSLAGSALTMDQALRNLVQVGMALADASQRVSTFPADYLGLADRGRIAPDMRADLVVVDAQLQLQQVFAAGTAIDLHVA
ncbi:N-acetylglucosamine-6-phosphate deacetylase [Stenotrophomonas sp. 24(2023)]|uniref:N-acetylglucosamine-6-phosphate deacetylase n=1 Tax=Stenotrophomonas sp. 24(2023) TaxID=3068324 RepID=UPI0027E0CC89|nr:N-acetylglucosamine-6-phosphate deacetylase [Stenotrophomonas sp. 24(2023)]WMJ70884.1 N-acetylglucosamine-6-phosphate deacetylase [Stenotrophomonas sp. 24(2023)]